MDEEERLKKIRAGREKLAAFKKKRSRKKKRRDDGDPNRSDATDSEMSDVTDSETSSVMSLSDVEFVSDNDEGGTDEDGSGLSLMKHSKIMAKLKDAFRHITELEETIYGKERAVDSLFEENQQLRVQLSSQVASQNTESGEKMSLVNTDQLMKNKETYDKKVEQLERILSEKDKAIEDLSVSLQSVTENRDLLQAEYVEQASQLSQQVHILQEQLRQTSEWLHKPTGETGVPLDVLLEAKNELLALQASNREKDQHLLLLQEAIKQRDHSIAMLKIEQNKPATLSEDMQEKLEEYVALKQEQYRNRQAMNVLEQEHANLVRINQENNDLIRKLKEDIEVSRHDEHRRLDETYRAEMVRVKEDMSELYSGMISRLKGELKQVTDERNKFSQQVNTWQRQYLLLSEQNISNADLSAQIGMLTTENMRYREQVEGLRCRVDELLTEKQETLLELQSSSTTLENLEKRLQCDNCSRLKKEVNDLNVALQEARHKISGYEQRIEQLEVHITTARQQLESVKAQHEQEIKDWHEKYDNSCVQLGTVRQQLDVMVKQQEGAANLVGRHQTAVMHEFETKLQQQQRQHETTLQEISSQHQQQLEQLRQQYNDSLENAVHGINQQLMEKTQHQQQASDTYRRESENREQRINEILAERDRALTELKQLVSERDETKQQLDLISYENADLKKRLDVISGENNMAADQLETMREEWHHREESLERVMEETRSTEVLLQDCFGEEVRITGLMEKLQAGGADDVLKMVQTRHSDIRSRIEHVQAERRRVQEQVRSRDQSAAGKGGLQIAGLQIAGDDLSLIAKLSDQLGKLRLLYAENVEAVKIEIRDVLLNVEDVIRHKQQADIRYSENMLQLQTEHQNSIQKMASDHQNALEKARLEHENTVRQMTSEHENMVERMITELNQTREKNKELSRDIALLGEKKEWESVVDGQKEELLRLERQLEVVTEEKDRAEIDRDETRSRFDNMEIAVQTAVEEMAVAKARCDDAEKEKAILMQDHQQLRQRVDVLQREHGAQFGQITELNGMVHSLERKVQMIDEEKALVRTSMEESVTSLAGLVEKLSAENLLLKQQLNRLEARESSLPEEPQGTDLQHAATAGHVEDSNVGKIRLDYEEKLAKLQHQYEEAKQTAVELERQLDSIRDSSVSFHFVDGEGHIESSVSEMPGHVCKAASSSPVEKPDLRELRQIVVNDQVDLTPDISPIKTINYEDELEKLKQKLADALTKVDELMDEKQALIDEHEQEMRELLLKMDSLFTDEEVHRCGYSEQMKEVTDELNESRSKLDQVVSEAEHLKQEHEKEVSQIESEHIKTIESLAMMKEDLRAQYQQEMTGLKKTVQQLQHAISDLEAERTQLDAEYETELRNVTLEHESRIKNITEIHEQEVERLKLELNETKTKLVEEQELMSSQYIEQVDRLKQQCSYLADQMEHLRDDGDSLLALNEQQTNPSREQPTIISLVSQLQSQICDNVDLRAEIDHLLRSLREKDFIIEEDAGYREATTPSVDRVEQVLHTTETRPTQIELKCQNSEIDGLLQTHQQLNDSDDLRVDCTTDSDLIEPKTTVTVQRSLSPLDINSTKQLQEASSIQPSEDFGSIQPSVDAGSTQLSLAAGFEQAHLDTSSTQQSVDLGSTQPSVDELSRRISCLSEAESKLQEKCVTLEKLLADRVLLYSEKIEKLEWEKVELSSALCSVQNELRLVKVNQQAVTDVCASEGQVMQQVSDKASDADDREQSVSDKTSGTEGSMSAVSDKGSGIEKCVPSVCDKGSGTEWSMSTVSDKASGIEKCVPSVCDKGSGTEWSMSTVSDKGSGSEKCVPSVLDRGSGTKGSMPSVLDKGCGTEENIPSVSNKGTSTEWSMPYVSDKGSGTEESISPLLDNGSGTDKSVLSVSEKGSGTEVGLLSVSDKGSGPEMCAPSVSHKGSGIDDNLMTLTGQDDEGQETDRILDIETEIGLSDSTERMKLEVDVLVKENQEMTERLRKYEDENKVFVYEVEKYETENKNLAERIVNSEETNTDLKVKLKTYEEENRNLTEKVAKCEEKMRCFVEKVSQYEDEKHDLLEYLTRYEVGHSGVTERLERDEAENTEQREKLVKVGDENLKGRLEIIDTRFRDLAERLETYEAENSNLKERLEKYDGEIEALAEKLTECEQENRDLTEKVGTYEDDKRYLMEKLEKYESNDRDTTERLTGFEHENRSLKEEFEKCKGENRDLQERLASNLNDNRDLAEELEKYKDKNEFLTQRIGRSDNEIGILGTKLAQYENEIVELTEKMAEYEDENRNLSERFLHLESENGNHIERLKEFRDENRDLAEKLVAVELECTDLKGKLGKSEQQARDIAETLERYETENENLTEGLEDLESKKRDLQERFAKSEEEIQGLKRRVGEFEDGARDMTTTLAQCEDENRLLAERLGKSEKENRNLMAKLGNYEEEHREILEKLEALEDEKKVFMERVAKYDSENADLKAKVDQYDLENGNLSERLIHLETEKSDITEKFVKYECENTNLVEQVSRLTRVLTGEQDKLHHLQSEMEVKTKEFFELETKHKQLLHEHVELENVKGEMLEEIAMLKNGLSTTEQQLAEVMSEKLDLIGIRSGLKVELEDQKQRYQELEAQREKAMEDFLELEALKQKYLEMEKEKIEQAENVLAEMDIVKHDAESEISHMKEQFAMEKQQLEAGFQTSQNGLRSLIDQLEADKEGLLELHEQDLNRLVAENGQLKVQTAQLMESLEQVKVNLAHIQQNSDKLQEERSALEQTISDMKNSHRELEGMVGSLQTDKLSLEEEVQSKESIIDQLTQRNSTLESEISSNQEDLQRKEELLMTYHCVEEEHTLYKNNMAQHMVLLKNEILCANQELSLVRKDVQNHIDGFQHQFTSFCLDLGTVTQRAAEVRHQLEDDFCKLREQNQMELDQHTKDIKQLQAEKANLQEELKALEQRHNSACSQAEVLLKEKAVLQDQYDEVTLSLERQIELNTANLNADRQTLTELHNKQLQEMEQTIGMLKMERSKLLDERNENLSKIETLEEAMTTAMEDLDVTRRDLATEQKNVETLTAENLQLLHEKEVWQEQSKDMRSKESSLTQTLEGLKTEWNSTEKTLQEDVRNILREKDGLLTRVRNLEEEKSDVESRMRKSSEEYDNEVKRLTEEVSDLKEMGRTLEGDHRLEMENIRADHDAVIARIEEQFRESISERNDLRVKLSNELSSHDAVIGQVRAKMEDEISELKTEIGLMTVKNAELDNRHAELMTEIDHLKCELLAQQVTVDDESSNLQLKEGQQKMEMTANGGNKTCPRHSEDEAEDLKQKRSDNRVESESADVDSEEKLATLTLAHQAQTELMEGELKEKDLDYGVRLMAIGEEKEGVISKLKEENRQMLVTIRQLKLNQKSSDIKEENGNPTTASCDESLRASLSKMMDEHQQTMMAMQSQIEILQTEKVILANECSEQENALLQQHSDQVNELQQHIAVLERKVGDFKKLTDGSERGPCVHREEGEDFLQGSEEQSDGGQQEEMLAAAVHRSAYEEYQTEIREYRDIIKLCLNQVDSQSHRMMSGEVSPGVLKELLDELTAEKKRLMADLKEKDLLIKDIQKSGQQPDMAQGGFSPLGDVNEHMEELRNEIQTLRHHLHHSQEDKTSLEHYLTKLSAYIEEQDVIKRQLQQERNQLLSAIDELKMSAEATISPSDGAMVCEGRKVIESDEHQLSLSSSDGDQESTSSSDRGELASASSRQDQLSKVIQKFERKIQRLKEQHETELKVLEFNLTESYKLENNKTRLKVVEELEEDYEKRRHELENDFIQKENALKAELERKFVKELQNMKQQLAAKYELEMKESRESTNQNRNIDVRKVRDQDQTNKDFESALWQLTHDGLNSSADSLPKYSVTSPLDSDNHTEGFLEEKDEDLQVKVKQLEDENRFLKMRLENQNLGMQESLQEELLVMYNRYDTLLRENQKSTSKREPEVSLTSDGHSAMHYHQSTSEDNSLSGYLDWKLKCEALEKENKILRAELHVCGPAGIEHQLSDQFEQAQQAGLIQAQPIPFEHAQLGGTGQAESTGMEKAQSGGLEKANTPVLERTVAGAKHQVPAQVSGNTQAMGHTLDTCTIVQREYYTLHTQIEGLKTVFVPDTENREISELQEKCKQLIDDNQRHKSEHQNLLSKYQELIQELEDLKVLLGKSKDKSKKDYIKMKAKALALSKDNERLLGRIAELESLISSQKKSDDLRADLKGLEEEQGRSPTEVERTPPTTEKREIGTSKRRSGNATREEGFTGERKVSADAKHKISADKEGSAESYFDKGRVVGEEPRVQSTEDSTGLLQGQSAIVSDQNQSAENESISQSDYERMQHQYSSLQEEYNLLKSVTLAGLEKNYQQLVEEHSKLRQAMEKQTETLQSKIKRLEIESYKLQSDRKQQDALAKKIEDMERSVISSAERYSKVEEQLTKEREKHTSQLEEIELLLVREKDKNGELHKELHHQEMSIWWPIRLSVNSLLIAVSLVYAYLHHRYSLRGC